MEAPDLQLLGSRAEHEDRAYAALLAQLNTLAALPLPDEASRLHAHLAHFISVLAQYTQHVVPVVDARDRLAMGVASSRLEAFGRQLEALTTLRDGIEAAMEQVRAIRLTLSQGAAPPPLVAAATHAAEEASYVAFENRFRGTTDELSRRVSDYVPLLAQLAPVVDLGSGRGELLDLLRKAGIEARGVDANAHAVAECRSRGLDVTHGDLVDYLRAQADGSVGGVVAVQVAEHLSPLALRRMLEQAHRVLRPGGRLLLETINARSAWAFFEVYIRDLSHERPLHQETLLYLAAAHGFTDVRIELRSPIDAAARLQPIPGDGLAARTLEALNENVDRLNQLLFAPQEYVLLARR